MHDATATLRTLLDDAPDTFLPRILPLSRHAPPQEPASNTSRALFLRDRNGLQRVERTDIRSLVADGNYVELHTIDKRFVLRNSLREVLMQLDDHRFVQVNRNTVINIDRLFRVDADSVEVDGQCLTLSRNFRNALIDRLNILSGR